MANNGTFSPSDLVIDSAAEAERIAEAMRQCVMGFKKRGIVLGVSGGIDSSLVAALSVKAVGADRTFVLFMPDRESAGDSLWLGRLLVESLGIRSELVDITATLEALGCYARRDEAIRTVIPHYTSEYKCKIVLPSLLESEKLRVFSVVVESPNGEQTTARLSSQAYLEILAAMNFKQRVRKMLEYYYADRFNYAVAGTPNRQEYDQGFFVKLGDGSADLKPIAHLYKTQVYRMAEHLSVPDEIVQRPPTTDTYSMQQSQEEFYFSVPYDVMDYCLYGVNENIPAHQIAEATDLTAEQVERVYREIDNKRVATKYQHAGPVLVEKVLAD